MDDLRLERARVWHGTLTALAAIAELPWARVWNLRSGRPVRVKPLLQGKKMPRGLRKAIGKAIYCSHDMVNFLLADRLLKSGIPGPSVQEILDKNVLRVGGTSEVTADNLLCGQWVIVHDPTAAFPIVKFFPPEEGDQTFKEELAHPAPWVQFFIEQTRSGRAVASISLGGLIFEVYERIDCFLNRVPYKTAGARATEALEKERNLREMASESSRLA